MDQLRMVLNWFKRQHFWVLCIALAAIALACWYSAANALHNQFVQNERTIKQEFDAQSRLRQQSFHANDAINNRQLEEIKKQGDSVAATWQRLYDRQRQEVLKWPDQLSEKFRSYVARLKFGDPIPVDLRNNYLNYVEGHLKSLLAHVKARELKGDGRAGSGYRARSADRGSRGSRERGGSREGDQEDYIVEWLDQGEVRDELYMSQTPSSTRIWVTQEDLWVYHTLLQIIANTNEAAGADRNSNAAVRVIESLEVGRPAAKASLETGRLLLLGESGVGGMGGDPRAAGGRGGVPAGGRGSFGTLEGGRGGAEGTLSEAEEKAMLLSGRYLDASGNPIASVGQAGASAFGVEYKRLPVRMRLIMDQRWLTHLIAECANAPLQVEVREVRINPSTAQGGGRGYEGQTATFTPSRRSGREGEAVEFPPEPNVVPVEIQGMIYIFNEPDPAVLQVQEPQV